MDAKLVVRKALENGLVVPAFNIPHPPMLKPIVQAVVDEDSVAMIQVARLEWEKFESVSLEHIAGEYGKDHTTVIHSVDKIERNLGSSSHLQVVVKEITANVNGKM